MSYFREIPNLRYPSFLKEKTSSLDYVEAKNLFRRTKLRDDLQNNFTVFNNTNWLVTELETSVFFI